MTIYHSHACSTVNCMKVLIEDKEAICEEQAKREDMSSSDGLDAPPPLCPSIISLDEAIPSLNSGEDVPCLSYITVFV